MKNKVLVIDDEERLRSLLKRIISLEGYETFETGTINTARQLLKKQDIDIILCDVKLPDGNGVSFTKEVKNEFPYVEIILLTAYGNIPDGVQAIKNGASDYLVKGDDNNKILPLLNSLSEKIALQQQIKRIGKSQDNPSAFNKIIGSATAIKNAIHLAEKVASTETAVLLTGETGTGKEIFAQAIHFSSKRSDKTLVALNCSAFNKELLESELFGHKAGSFTGALKDKKGLIEEANGGTLFLDEIGELPFDLQPKLLRLLENGTFMRVGETKEQKADIRIISATNRNLQEEIIKGNFREDLYFRIAVFTIELPPLRERVKDIPLLAQYYLEIFASKTRKNISSISEKSIELLKSAEWKGNIRELKNIIERAVILEDSNVLSIESLPYELQHPELSTIQSGSPFSLATIEQQHIKKVLLHTGGNKTETARLLNIGLATLYRKIEEYGLK